jgi:hypothetical protein
VFNRAAPIFAAFDVLSLNSKDLRDRELLERKAILRRVVREKAARALYVGHIVGKGKALYQQVCAREVEGIVAKPIISHQSVQSEAAPVSRRRKGERRYRCYGKPKLLGLFECRDTRELRAKLCEMKIDYYFEVGDYLEVTDRDMPPVLREKAAKMFPDPRA